MCLQTVQAYCASAAPLSEQSCIAGDGNVKRSIQARTTKNWSMYFFAVLASVSLDTT